jgi:epoxyqueuosine reductase
LKGSEEIVARAHSLFDVVGVASDPSINDTILIIGLVSTPERDLDDFVSEGTKTILRGFARHAKDKEDALIEFIREQGSAAELVGELGYPLNGKPNLKHLAVAAGLGKQGKNTLVIHPRFGPWLRFMAIKTDAPLAPTGPGIYSKEENPYCENCQECVQACPVGILLPYRLADAASCLAAISEGRPSELAICDKCVVVCPVGERKAP